MHPVLFRIFDYPVHLYAVMIALGFIFGVWIAARHADRVGLDRDMILDLCWWMLVSGLVGSRIAFIVVNFDQYWLPCVDVAAYNAAYPDDFLTEPDCWRLARFWNGGLVFLGGVIAGLITLVWFVRKEKVKLLPVADTIIPSLALGQFFGRLGCLAAGCCWGKETDVSWGIIFPRGSMVYREQLEEGLLHNHLSDALPIHPTQLYDSLAGLTLFCLLLWIRNRKRYHGQVFVWWLFIYPLMRSTIEIFRGDSERGYLFRVVSEPLNQFLGLPAGSPTFMSTSQAISLGLTGLAVIMMIRARSQNRTPTAPTSTPAPG